MATKPVNKTKASNIDDENTKKTESKSTDVDIEKILKDNEDLKKANAEYLKKLNTFMESQNNNNQNASNIISNNSNRNIRVTSLMGHDFILSTSDDIKNKGKTFKFSKFGQSMSIRFNDMLDILRIFIDRFEAGKVIIERKQDAIDLDVEYLYDLALTKEKVQDLVELKQESDVDVILDMSKEMQENICGLISTKITGGFKYDMNLIKRLEDNGLKISKTAEAIKGFNADEQKK